MKLLHGYYFSSLVYLLSLCRHVCGEDGENDSPEPLQIVAFGDWGKGGSHGDILSVSTESLIVKKGIGVLKTKRERKRISRFHQLRGYNEGQGEPEEEGDEHDHEHDEHDHEHDEHGRQEYTYQVAVAGGISAFINSSAVNTSCILALGDNFYDDGVLTTNDTMWTTHWKDVYLRNYTNLRIPWHPIFGNHDYGYGDVGAAAQIQRAKDILDSDDISAGLWQFDSYNYSKCMDLPGTVGGTLCLIFIDTTTLAPSEERNCNEEGGISTDTQAARIADQLFHVEQMLIAAENSTWVVVCGHYPIYTSGEHGDSSELITYLQPLIAKYNVSMYLAGHDHLSGHLQHEGIEYFIAGGGAMVDPLGDVSSVATDVWYGTGYAAFSVLQVTKNTLAIKFIHWNGTEMYNYTLHNPRNNASLLSVPNPTPAPSRGPERGKGPRSGSGRSIHLVVPDVPPSLLYIAVAAGSLTGLMLSILFFPLNKRKKTKRKGSGSSGSVRGSRKKKNKKYTSLPITPHRDDPHSPSALCSPSIARDTHPRTRLPGSALKRTTSRARGGLLPLSFSPEKQQQHQLQGPNVLSRGHLSPPSSSPRHSLPLPPSPADHSLLFPPSPPRHSLPLPPSPTVAAGTSPLNPFNRMRRGGIFSAPATTLGLGHRKTKSEDATSLAKASSPRRLEPSSPSSELGLPGL